MSTRLQRHSTTIYLGMNSLKENAAMLLVGVLLCLPVLTNASNTTMASATSTTTATITTATDIIPKVIIAIAVIAFAAGIGVGVAKLLDYIYDHSRLNDNASDMSEHTKEMLKTQMILMKMKTKKKKLGDEEQGDGEPKKQSKLKSLVQRVASARPKSKEEGSDKNLHEEADKQTSGDMKDSVENENETDGAKTEAAKTESDTQAADKPTDDKNANEKPSNASKDESDPKLKKVESKDALHTGHASVTRTTSDMLGSVGGPSASAVKDKPTPTVVKDKPTPTATSGAASPPENPTTPRAQSSKGSPRRDSSPGGKHLAGQLPAGKKGSTAGNSS